jgi:hypothetical protein
MVYRFVATSDAVWSRIEEHQFDRQVYFGSPDVAGAGPQIYVNTVDPGVELAAHFHKVDQFQVFFGTPGAMFKRREISPLMVHYTDAYSTYGPFRAAVDRPLRYATIRAESSNFGGVMPGARDELVRRGRRSMSVPVEQASLASVPAPGGSSVVDVIGEHDDGLAARLVLLGAGSEQRLSSQQRSAGRAWLIVAGDLIADQSSYAEGAIGWSSSDEPEVVVTAGQTGAVVLLLDFPSPPTNMAPLEAEQEEGVQ